MTILELIVVLAASPIVATLIYGTWKFAADGTAKEQDSPAPVHKNRRYRNLKKALAA